MDDITTRHNPHEPADPGENPRVAYEHGDADVFTVSKYAIGLAFGVIIAAAAMWALFSWFQAQDEAEINNVPKAILAERPNLPPTPRLQQFPKVELKNYEAEQLRVLNSYTWVDPERGIVRIPVKKAIEAVAAQGLPSRSSTKGYAGVDEDGYRMMPEKSSSGRTFERVSQ